MQASISQLESGTMIPSNTVLVTGVLDMADAQGVTIDCLLDGAVNEVAKARFEDRELLKQFQEVEQISDEDKFVVKKLLDAFLIKERLQALAR